MFLDTRFCYGSASKRCLAAMFLDTRFVLYRIFNKYATTHFVHVSRHSLAVRQSFALVLLVSDFYGMEP